MIKKVEFFKTFDISDLQNRINEFIIRLPSHSIKDIKYDIKTEQNEYGNWTNIYTAMVVYNDQYYPDNGLEDNEHDMGYSVSKPL